jgi:hypothetical protein
MLRHWRHEARPTVSNVIRALLGVLAVVALVATFAGCQTGTKAADLAVGDCFNRTPTTDVNGDNVIDNTLAACAQAHDVEVYLVFEVPAASGGYPSDEASELSSRRAARRPSQTTWTRTRACRGTGINYVRPDSSTWANGDHMIACLIEDASGGMLTGSAKDSNE